MNAITLALACAAIISSQCGAENTNGPMAEFKPIVNELASEQAKNKDILILAYSRIGNNGV